MNRIRKAVLSVVALAAFAADAASAATFVGSTGVAGFGSTYSIVTNKSDGALASADFIDWSFLLEQGGKSITLNKTNSIARALGAQVLKVVGDTIVIDTSVGDGVVGFDTPGPAARLEPGFDLGLNDQFKSAIGFQTGGAFGLGFGSPNNIALRVREAGTPYSIVQDFGVGQFVVARRVAGAVPEPATWLIMVVGFGLIGGAMRRRAGMAIRGQYT